MPDSLSGDENPLTTMIQTEQGLWSVSVQNASNDAPFPQYVIAANDSGAQYALWPLVDDKTHVLTGFTAQPFKKNRIEPGESLAEDIVVDAMKQAIEPFKDEYQRVISEGNVVGGTDYGTALTKDEVDKAIFDTFPITLDEEAAALAREHFEQVANNAEQANERISAAQKQGIYNDSVLDAQRIGFQIRKVLALMEEVANRNDPDDLIADALGAEATSFLKGKETIIARDFARGVEGIERELRNKGQAWDMEQIRRRHREKQAAAEDSPQTGKPDATPQAKRTDPNTDKGTGNSR